jgi:hypothetical protein
MKGVLPPLVQTVTAPLYFLDYDTAEFEPVLDERMVVYSYVAVDLSTVSPGFRDSQDYQILLSRLLYVDRDGDCYGCSPDLLKKRWQSRLHAPGAQGNLLRIHEL